jgi:hypothetical protein
MAKKQAGTEPAKNNSPDERAEDANTRAEAGSTAVARDRSAPRTVPTYYMRDFPVAHRLMMSTTIVPSAGFRRGRIWA